MLIAEVDWTHVWVALIAGIPATLAAIGALLASLRNGGKADDIQTSVNANTIITKKGTEDAATAAIKAAETATKADNKITHMLNGVLEHKITTIVKEQTQPLVEAFHEHKEQDKANMTRLEGALKDLANKITDGIKDKIL